jgi:DNA mismatch repair protein MutL
MAPRERPAAPVRVEAREEPARWMTGEVTAAVEEADARPVSGLPALRPLGQFADSYLIAVGPDGVYLVDQHAAHERVFFEALERPTPARRLLEPLLLHLSPEEERRWDAFAGDLQRLGLEAEPFGDGALLIRSVPAGLDTDPLTAVSDVLARAETGPDTLTSARRALAACKAAIKAGARLGPEDQEALLQQLAACRHPYTCPHGRPTLLRWSLTELERHFGRR